MSLMLPYAKLPTRSGEEPKEVFHERLGEGVQIDIEYVDEILPEKSGKFRYVVSRVAV